MAFKKAVSALLVICIVATVGVATCGCDDLGEYSSTEEYYDSFDDIILISGTTKEKNEYSVEDYFYNDLCWEPEDEVVREFMNMIKTVTNP